MGSRVFVPVLLLAASCGSSETPVSALSTGTATIDGTFTFLFPHAPAWSAASIGTETGAFTVVVSNLTGGDACFPLRLSNDTTPNLFRLTITHVPGTPFPPGTYPVGGQVNAAYVQGDSACATKSAGTATSGSVEIDRVGPAILGIADLMFPEGRVITTFNAPVCTGPASTAPDGGFACSGAPAH